MRRRGNTSTPRLSVQPKFVVAKGWKHSLYFVAWYPFVTQLLLALSLSKSHTQALAMKYSLFAGLLAITAVDCRVLLNAHHIEELGETVEDLRQVPQGWIDVGAPAMDLKLHFRVALRSVSTLLPHSMESRLANPGSGNRSAITIVLTVSGIS